MPTISREFAPNPGPQTAFWKCESRIVGYGGAMGGGKSRAFCEKALEIAVDCPGVPIVIAPGDKIARLLSEWISQTQTRTSDGGFVFIRSNVPIYGIELFFRRDLRVLSNVPAFVLGPNEIFTPPPQ